MNDLTPPVLARVRRSGFTESVHRGSVVVLAADGSVAHAAGDVDSPMFPRSSIKPVQAAAMLGAGADLTGKLLALAAASHAGELFHLDGVQEILGAAGLDVEALRCPAELPLDMMGKLKFIRETDPTDRRLTMNCSGKHAAMLLTCVANGWPVDTYLDPEHPLQLRITAEIAAAAGEPVTHLGTDGCGAPLAAISLTGLARALRSFSLAEPGSARARVAEAMRAHPEYVGGTNRPDTWVMRAVPGTLCKVGAEGVQIVALPDGRAAAVKLEDGDAGHRAANPVFGELLRTLCVDSPVLDQLAEATILGGGKPVGSVEAVPIPLG